MATQAIQQKVVTKVGVVVAAHRCAQTVKVRVAKTVKDKHIRKVGLPYFIIIFFFKKKSSPLIYFVAGAWGGGGVAGH